MLFFKLVPLPVSHKPGIIKQGVKYTGSVLWRKVLQNIPEHFFRGVTTYEIVSTGFRKDRWVQMSEVRPSARAHVHHAVVYVRPPDSQWLRKAPVGAPFTASTLKDAESRRQAMWTDSDILLVYAPGSSPDRWPDGMAKFIPAGSDLVLFRALRSSDRRPMEGSTISIS